MNKKSPSASVSKVFMSALRRFHLTIFFVLIVSLLAGGVLMVNQIVTEGELASDGYKSSIDAGSIDEATLQRIQSLHQSGETVEPTPLPDGRINPFSE